MMEIIAAILFALILFTVVVWLFIFADTEEDELVWRNKKNK